MTEPSLTSSRPRVLVVEPSGGDLGRLLRATNAVDVVSVSTLGPAVESTAPAHVAVLDADFVGPALADAAETVRQRGLAYEVVVVAGTADFDVMRRAMLAGVREFLTRPLQPSQLVEAIRKTAREAPAAAAPTPAVPPPSREPVATGKVIAVFSPRGGAGCTTIAANLASILSGFALQQGNRVAVVDGRPEFGGLAAALALDSGKKLVEWPTSAGGEVDGLLVEHWSGVQVLLPPDRGPLGDDQLPTVTAALRTRFSFVVLDLGHDLDGGTEAVLRLADHTVLVTTTDVAALLQVGHVLDRLQLLGAIGRTVLVVNRADERPSIQAGELGRRLGLPVTAALPVDGALRDALDVGVPLVLRDPASKTAQRFLALAEAVAGPLATPGSPLPLKAGPGEGGMPELSPVARRRRELYTLATVLIVGTLLGAATLLFGLDALRGTPLDVSAAPARSVPARPSIGTPVRDRFWEYTVVSVEAVEPDARYFTRRPAGKFLAVNLRLQNVSGQSGILAQHDVRLRDDRGGEYDVSTEGSLGYYLRSRLTNPFVTPIAPRLAVNTAFVFDVPDQGRSYVLRVQGAPFSEPVEIALSR